MLNLSAKENVRRMLSTGRLSSQENYFFVLLMSYRNNEEAKKYIIPRQLNHEFPLSLAASTCRILSLIEGISLNLRRILLVVI